MQECIGVERNRLSVPLVVGSYIDICVCSPLLSIFLPNKQIFYSRPPNNIALNLIRLRFFSIFVVAAAATVVVVGVTATMFIVTLSGLLLPEFHRHLIHPSIP